MILRVDDAENRISLDGVELPGVFQGLTVTAEWVTDDRKRPNRSGSSVRTKGMNDVEIRMQLAFPGSRELTPYDQIRVLNQVFTQLDAKGQAQPLTLIDPHVQAYGFSKVTFLRLATGERTDSTVLTGGLEFRQWRPLPKVSSKERLKQLEHLLLRGEIEYDRYARLAKEAGAILGDPKNYAIKSSAAAADIASIGTSLARSVGFGPDETAAPVSNWPPKGRADTQKDYVPAPQRTAGPRATPPTATPYEDETP